MKDLLHPSSLSSGRPGSLKLWAVGVFLASLLLYVSAALYLYARLEPSGDESAYLLLAHSIAFDGDVDLRNNLEGEDYRRFFHDSGLASCEPALDLRGDGTWRSIHGVGLPLLIALPYRLAGRLGAVLTVAACAAAMSTALFLAAREICQDTWAALLACGLVSFTLPVLPMAGKVFPEIPSAAVLLLAFYLILPSSPPTSARVLAAGVLLAFLPWLHTKNLLPAGLLLVWAFFRWRTGTAAETWLRLIVLLSIPMALSLALQGFLFLRWYGSPLPSAPYRISFGYPWFVYTPAHIYQGVTGAVLDQEFGLLFHAPFYIAALAGLVPLFRDRRGVMWIILATWGGLIMLSSVFIMWWGGNSPPARLTLPAIPLLGIPLAMALSRWRRWGFRVPFLGLGLLSLLLTSLFLAHPGWLRCEDDDRMARPFRELGLPQWAPLFPATAVREITYGAYGLPYQAGQVREIDGRTVLYVGPGHPPGGVAQRLDLQLPRGSYRIRCRMRVVPLGADPAAPLAVLSLSSDEGQLLLEREITPADLPSPPLADGFQAYDLVWHNDALSSLTFQVTYTGAASMWLETTTVGPACGFVDAGQVAFWAAVCLALALWWNWRGAGGPGARE